MKSLSTEVAERTRKSILGGDSSAFRWLDSKFSDDAVSSGQHRYRYTEGVRVTVPITVNRATSSFLNALSCRRSSGLLHASYQYCSVHISLPHNVCNPALDRFEMYISLYPI